ncbi:TraR/DksA family transcriptional regulator [Herminiimonas sp. CN]|uniref:TraR/DksA family transcriptional regulator n=1 Tax=Herminiimonas sp. CN TaxID=1349818 RepID=UPI0012DC1806|nr:TraR/DksA family transcriptional regulator [Herminiimonas sp. CN]
MDEKYLEIADALMNSIIEAGINGARSRQKRPDDFDGDCSCGAAIPTDRVDAGYYNCVPCQERIEKHDKHYRG